MCMRARTWDNGLVDQQEGQNEAREAIGITKQGVPGRKRTFAVRHGTPTDKVFPAGVDRTEPPMN